MPAERLRLQDHARAGTPRRRPPGAAAALGILMMGSWLGPAHAQTVAEAAEAGAAGQGRRGGPAVATYFSASQTFTDNGRQSAGERRSDAITRLAPGIRWRSDAGPLQGSADYALTGVVYANDSFRNELQNSLRARASWAAVERHLTLDLTGNVSRQSVSAFGPVGTGEGMRANQTEVASFSIGPTLTGRLGTLADVQARWLFQRTRTDGREAGSATGNADDSTAHLRLADPSPGSRLSWLLDATRQRFDPEEGRTTEIDRINGTLSFGPQPDLILRGLAGWEANNFTNLRKSGRTTYGAGLEWRPSERTRLSADAERRFFGQSHHLRFEHRLRRLVWRVVDTRDVASNASRFTAALGTVYDLFFLQFASIEPDPVRRDELVRGYLAANGLSPTALVSGGFLSSGASLDRRQEVSVAWRGLRSSATLAYSRTRSERLDALSGPIDDFSRASQIDQRGLALTLGYRLTPESSATLGLSWVRSDGASSGTGSAAGLSTRQRAVDLGWSHRLGSASNLSIVLRHAAFDSQAAPFDENALTATFSTQF